MKKIRWMKKICVCLIVFAVAVSTSGCTEFFSNTNTQIKNYEPSSEASSEEQEEIIQIEWEDALVLAADYMKTMTLEEKVGQLFIVNLEQLDHRKGNYYEFRKYTKTMQKSIEKYHVGGVILFSRNIAKRKQTVKLTSGLVSADRTPLFITVDEEGGRVSRIASNKKMKTTMFPAAEEIGKTQDDQYTYEMAKTIGAEIKELGFNVDFAPVADVKTSELNEEIGDRSFGSDPDKVSEYVSAFVQGLHKVNVGATLKHFPGQGSSSGDTHVESVDIDSSIARLRKTDFLPFKAGIAADADFVMVSHISVSKVTESSVPASMSDLMMQTILRDELGLKKVIITDAFDMASIVDNYTSGEAAYNAFKAGADIILMPQDFEAAYQEILGKIQDGTIERQRLDDSVLRILAVKIQRGILTEEQLQSTPEPTSIATPEVTKEPAKKTTAKKNASKKQKAKRQNG